MEKTQTVVVLGASPKPERYSNQTAGALCEHGCTVIPVNPSGCIIHGLTATKSLDDIKTPVDTLTIYVNAQISSDLREVIVKLNPGRVIFNPGTENPELEKFLSDNGIRFIHACTLVLLRTGQFEEA